uniref:Uncharacterized protein LOC101242997 n=1 Tax=Phallusia mammillata TaxID=59560 RepID=A0A6F9DJI4_9ASCI|nr:uncharacterized protein LOC101242997 [Phallusia mammillata]
MFHICLPLQFDVMELYCFMGSVPSNWIHGSINKSVRNQSPAIVFISCIPTFLLRLVIVHGKIFVVYLLRHQGFCSWGSVILWTIGTHVHDWTVGVDFVIYVGWKFLASQAESDMAS